MLQQIVASADERARQTDMVVKELVAKAAVAPPVRDFARALISPALSVIAEIKRRSPSAGDIDIQLDPVKQAIAYESGGADAVSVLTEPDFFGGSLQDLESVRSAVSIPVLRKDFTRRPSQIWEARASGADAVLIIVASLTDDAIAILLATAKESGMTAIVEAHTTSEVKRALLAGATVIGVNNRDLQTFETDLSTSEIAAIHLPEAVVKIAESGVSSVDGAARMARAGYDAILVGEALVRSTDPTRLVAELKAAR
jgi:indole-3-glycerol phosphate synthase